MEASGLRLSEAELKWNHFVPQGERHRGFPLGYEGVDDITH